MIQSVGRENPKRCLALRKDGQPCTAIAVRDNYCFGHAPDLEAKRREARRRGGANTSRVARAKRLLPARLRPVAELLEKALGEVHDGNLDPRVASAMASLAGALVRVVSSGELEERVRQLEEQLPSQNGKGSKL